MNKYYRKRFFLISIFIQFFVLTSLSQPSLSLDLYKLTLNGLSIKELTVEKVTNLLGRPTVSESNELLSEIIGPKLIYHKIGLEFWFNSKKQDPQQRVSIVSVKLVKKWDDKYKEFHMPFLGNIIPKLSANNKMSSVLPLFKNYPVTVQTADEYDKEIGKATEGLGLNRKKSTHDTVRIKNNSAGINIMAEEVTKFLEYISITFE